MLISEVKRSGLPLGAAAVKSGSLELVQAVVREVSSNSRFVPVWQV